MTIASGELEFFCRSCSELKHIDRASRRVRLGLRKYDRCLDCELKAQSKARLSNKEKISSRRKALYTHTRDRVRDLNLRRTYGITSAEWDEMFASQNHRCAICWIDHPRGRGWQTDHCHESGRVRGILCHHCNSLLGHAREAPDILTSAVRYLCRNAESPDAAIAKGFAGRGQIFVETRAAAGGKKF